MIRYHDNGYLDMGAVLSAPYPFIVVVGARGCGKTYGALEDVVKRHETFIYFRRTETVLKLVCDKALHVFKKLNANHGWTIKPEMKNGVGRFFDEGGDFYGYAAALSTFHNVRGFDGSDVKVLIFDEFIPEETERRTFNQWSALQNAIETIGRNRELSGEEPLKVVLLSNADSIYSDIIDGLGIADTILEMQETGAEEVEASSDLVIFRPKAPDFAAKKAQTALYRVAGGNDYAKMALHNTFAIDSREMIRRRNLSEYRPIYAIGGLCLYRHKSGRHWYASTHISGAPKTYETNEADRRRFYSDALAVSRAYARKKVFFEDLTSQSKFKALFD